jgi:hypothetical protein
MVGGMKMGEMTVGDLIEYLKTLDKDIPVVISDSAYPSEPLKREAIQIEDGQLTFY